MKKLIISFITIISILFLKSCNSKSFLKEGETRLMNEIDPIKLISEIDIDNIEEIRIDYFFPKDSNYSGLSIGNPLNSDSVNFYEKQIIINDNDIESNAIFINNYIKELLGLIIRNKQFEDESLEKKVAIDEIKLRSDKSDFVDNKEKKLQLLNNQRYKYQSCSIRIFLEFGDTFKFFQKDFKQRLPIEIQIYTSTNDISILMIDHNYTPNDIIEISYMVVFSRYVFEEEHYRLVYNLINYKNNQLRSENDNENIQNLELYNIEDVMIPYYIEKFQKE